MAEVSGYFERQPQRERNGSGIKAKEVVRRLGLHQLDLFEQRPKHPDALIPETELEKATATLRIINRIVALPGVVEAIHRSREELSAIYAVKIADSRAPLANLLASDLEQDGQFVYIGCEGAYTITSKEYVRGNNPDDRPHRVKEEDLQKWARYADKKRVVRKLSTMTEKDIIKAYKKAIG